MKLKDALDKKKFVVTSEIQPPVDETPEDIVRRLERVRGRVDGIAVSELDIEGIVTDTVKTCALLKENDFNAIYQTTTRGKNRLQIQKDLIRAHETGVENLLVFTEDYRITGDSLQELMFFHVDSGKLTSVLDHLQEGYTVDGEELPFKARFTFGSGIESKWGKEVPDLEMKEMEDMTRKGAGFFLTTPVFDVDLFEKFVQRVRTFGVPVIGEVMILRTAGMAQFLNRHFKSGLVPDRYINALARAPEKLKASIDIFTEIVSGLKEFCDGIHIITIGAEDKLGHYLDEARLKRL
jgi:methylenetetrahydrofolate reductase (NADPH)